MVFCGFFGGFFPLLFSLSVLGFFLGGGVCFFSFFNVYRVLGFFYPSLNSPSLSLVPFPFSKGPAEMPSAESHFPVWRGLTRVCLQQQKGVTYSHLFITNQASSQKNIYMPCEEGKGQGLGKRKICLK